MLDFFQTAKQLPQNEQDRLAVSTAAQIHVCFLGMYFPLEGSVEKELETAIKAGGKFMIYLGHRKVVIVSSMTCQDIKRLLETSILSQGVTIFSIWLLYTDRVPERQRHL